MTPRGTDWTLATLVALMVAAGIGSWFGGSPGSAWVIAAHDVGGIALAGVLVFKFRRVWRRALRPRPGLLAAILVVATLGTGTAWAFGADLGLAGFNGLAWHIVLGGVLALTVGIHMSVRARRPRRVDVAGRRQLLVSAGVGAAAFGAWSLQRPLSRALGWRGGKRRFTGSYEAASFSGNDFPATSWVADDPRPLRSRAVSVEGHVERERSFGLADLDAGDHLTATLDCTGGFHTTQDWRGVRLGTLLDRCGPRDGARHVRVVSVTGYRWSFSLDDARDLLLATHVGDEPLSHEHGAPVRLVAPGRRGFQWVKWVVRIEVHEDPDPGAVASTVWSSFTREGRGA